MDMEQHIETCVVDLAEMTYPKCPAMAPRWADLTDDDDEHGKDSDTDSAVLPPAAQEQDQSDGESSAPSVLTSGADSLASTSLSDGDHEPPSPLLSPPAAAAEAAPVWPSHSPGAASVTAAAPQQPWPVPVTVWWAFVPEWTFVPDHSGSVQHDEWQWQQQQHQQQQQQQQEYQESTEDSVLLLHDAGKCKPCLFAHTKTGCSKGDACQFCHLKHRSRAPRPSKSTRNRYKQIVAKVKETAGNTEVLQSWAKQHTYIERLLTEEIEKRTRSGR
mmetsp:Transcript_103460/g.277985  ORF Transcript_103460/g.277985 Transcript_103460/m.277985 type:complete len:273 (+) Transcript_103460:147-965(+)